MHEGKRQITPLEQTCKKDTVDQNKAKMPLKIWEGCMQIRKIWKRDSLAKITFTASTGDSEPEGYGDQEDVREL